MQEAYKIKSIKLTQNQTKALDKLDFLLSKNRTNIDINWRKVTFY